MQSFLTRFGQSPTVRRATVMFVALAWSSVAFCGEIHDAAKSGDLETVKALLTGNPNLVFSKDNNGETPLHDAVVMGHRDVAEFLVTNKANVNAMDNQIQRKHAPLGHREQTQRRRQKKRFCPEESQMTICQP